MWTPRCRGLIDQRNRFILYGRERECSWTLTADEVQVGFFKIEQHRNKQSGVDDHPLPELQQNHGDSADHGRELV